MPRSARGGTRPERATFRISLDHENEIKKYNTSRLQDDTGLTDFEPGNLTVLIGPNGAGKSNFISFFRLLFWALVPPGQLQVHVAMQSHANALLDDGASVTPKLEAEPTLTTESGKNACDFRLSHAAGDVLLFRMSGSNRTLRPASQAAQPGRGTLRSAAHRKARDGNCHRSPGWGQHFNQRHAALGQGVESAGDGFKSAQLHGDQAAGGLTFTSGSGRRWHTCCKYNINCFCRAGNPNKDFD
jgi:AAA domain, putative AbiEii toxin, Type IV TA system